MDDALITFLRDKTQLARFAPHEIQAVLDAMRAEGYEIKLNKREPMSPIEAQLRSDDAAMEGDAA